MYAWRDWVIAAFNAQHAVRSIHDRADSPATCCRTPRCEQRIATGFHRNHMLNEEGGIIPEEFLAEYCADRVETTADGLARPDVQLLPLPRSQVRSLHAARLLRPVRVLPQRAGEGHRQLRREHPPQRAAVRSSCRRRSIEAEDRRRCRTGTGRARKTKLAAVHRREAIAEHQAWTEQVDGADEADRRDRPADSDDAGDGGTAAAARDAHSDARRVRQAGRGGHCRHARQCCRRLPPTCRATAWAWRGGSSIRPIR